MTTVIERQGQSFSVASSCSETPTAGNPDHNHGGNSDPLPEDLVLYANGGVM